MQAASIARSAFIGVIALVAMNLSIHAAPSDGDSRPTRAAIRALLEREAGSRGLPPDIAEAVVQVESSFNPMTVGLVGEIGLMQVRPQTAAMLGFHGTPDELAKPEVNIHYGVKYLAKAWSLAGGDLCRALMKYRAGHGEEVMSPLSVTYCSRARSHLASLGSPYALEGKHLASLPEQRPNAQPPAAGKLGGPAALKTGAPQRVYLKLRQGSPAASRAFWAVHEARVRAIKARLNVKWQRVASR